MTREQLRIFVELAKNGAAARAYKKRLGLTAEEVNKHLAYLDEYEKEMVWHDAKKEVIEKKKEKSVKRAKSISFDIEKLKNLAEGPKTPNDDYYEDGESLPPAIKEED